MPNNPDSSTEQILQQLNRLDVKFDELRRELMASFVLKQVFDAVMEARDKELSDLKQDYEEHKQNDMGKLQRNVLIGAGLLGAITSLINILHYFHF
jgi:hypothetical protein